MSDTGPGSRVGSRFGPYLLRRLLGGGGTGEVYEAEDTRKHRLVALKLISPQFSANPVFRARLQREAQAAGRLTEPHVVPIHDYGEIDGKLYLDMRMIDGVSLRTILMRGGPLAPARAVAILRQIAAALDAAHATGLTHRDIKPENILIAGNDFAYLMDFGIARAATDPELTQTGIAIGSYKYMAPERFTGDEVTYRADVYSLACVFSECLTGSAPYAVDTMERLIAAHLWDPPPRPSQLRPGRVPPAIDQVIARGMAKDPEGRYRSAGELAAAAHDALTGSEQRHAVEILRHGERATSPTGATNTQLAGVEALTQARAWSRTPNPPVTKPAWMTPRAGGADWRHPASAPLAVSPAGPPDFSPSARPQMRFRDKRTLWIIVGATALLVVAAIAYVVVRPSGRSTQASGQTVLPFTGIDFRLSPGGVMVDTAGNVYVTSEGMYGRVVKLAPQSPTTTVLPFSGLYQPQGLAVDANGAVYVADFNNRVVKQAAGSNERTVLSFTGLNYPEGVAVDNHGSVYVADRGNDRVVKLPAGSSAQTVLPFTGLKNPDGVAVDAAGNVYVTDTDNNRVLRLDAGSNAQDVLPFTGVSVPWGIGLDSQGNVYVTEHDSNQILKLAAGASVPTVLPFSGLNTPLGVAVDKDGNVYVADRGNDRVVKLAA